MDKRITEIREEVERVYSTVNNFISEGVLPLIDMVYPNHDGKQDANQAADMMLLRDSLFSLANACNTGIEHINEAIDEETDDKE